MSMVGSDSSDGQAQTYEKVGQARVTRVGVQTSTAQILGGPTVPIEVENFVRIHPEVMQVEAGKITIDRGGNYGLVAGWTVTLWRFSPVDSTQSPDVAMRSKVREIVGRAVLTDIQPEMSTVRILGKLSEMTASEDFIQIDKQTSVRQKSGNTVYLNMATDLMGVLKPDMTVLIVFRPYKLLHPDGSGRVIRRQEKIAMLKISHLTAASYTARAVTDGDPPPDVLSGISLSWKICRCSNECRRIKRSMC